MIDRIQKIPLHQKTFTLGEVWPLTSIQFCCGFSGLTPPPRVFISLLVKKRCRCSLRVLKLENSNFFQVFMALNDNYIIYNYFPRNLPPPSSHIWLLIAEVAGVGCPREWEVSASLLSDCSVVGLLQSLTSERGLEPSSTL